LPSSGVGKLFARRATFFKKYWSRGLTLSLQSRKFIQCVNNHIFILQKILYLTLGTFNAIYAVIVRTETNYFHKILSFYENSKLPTLQLHCTVIGFALDWESQKSLKHDRECLTELLERALPQPYPIQRIQLAEVD